MGSSHLHLLRLFLPMVFSANIFWASSAAHTHSRDPFAIRISCGAREDVRTQPTNALWYRDFGYSGGRLANVTPTSHITPPLKTLRYFPLSDGPENCYNIRNIPNGHYAVRIFFALVADSNLDNEPVFDISVEGTQIYTLKSGWSNIDDQAFAEALVFVTDGSMSTCFHSTGHGDPSILSIEILQVDANAYNFGPEWGKGTVLRTAKRITCGSGKPAFDEDLNGDHWGGDRFWLGTSTFNKGSDQSISTENRITQASVKPNFYPEKLYQSAIVSTDRQPNITFQMEVNPNKNYSIWLHFAEIDPGITSKGQRVFDVLVNSGIAFTDVDIIQITGGHNAALVLHKIVAASGRTLTIILMPTNGSHAIINAIEVFEVISAEFRTSKEEVTALQNLKNSLGLPLRFGWNGDPCVPQQHPWSGVDCQFDSRSGKWGIDGLGLDNQGLRGTLPDDISKLRHLQSINLSGNSIQGAIPFSLGSITGLETLDLSFNQLNGSIPESLGQLTSLQILNLNGNMLSGRVPAKLGGRPLHRASFNFTGNSGLCGIPGLPACGPHLSLAAKFGIALAALLVLLLLVVCVTCWLKRRQNTLRVQKIASSREAPYAKSKTNFVRDVQMSKHQRLHEQSPTPTEGGLLP
ncbi:putative leucine-rich repeat receptor-like serine/threonine-protein kinase [Iris pallida]|uniref:Leucine-rich repeat receptor-like serine/threonine-protein kinase n=1 Tax=Iris pallida TaxID=29817 RepID=A0AAX6IJ45_IRIPA|nr:putative leucine-rich repeat receptor-like serine/threonine-protein kinase [Iris pallida]